MHTRSIIRFLLPLVITVIIQELGVQFLNGGMARMPNAMETLAGFGVAWGLVSFFASTLSQVKQMSLVLVQTSQGYRQVLRFVLGSGLLLGIFLVSLARTGFGMWFIEVAHNLAPSLALPVREMLFWLAPVPLVRGLALFYEGLLLRAKRTEIVSAAMLGNIIASIAAVFILLPTPLIAENSIWLPVFVVYAGLSVELLISYLGFSMSTRTALENDGIVLSYRYIFQFFWPLAFIMAVQGGSRPLINLFMSREADATMVLAVLTIVNPLAHIPYGWVNEIRNLAPAFQENPEYLQKIKRVTLACGLGSFGLMVALFWITPVREFIIIDLIGADVQLASMSVVPLFIFTFFPLAVMVRAYLHGVGLQAHRTKAMAPSAPARLAAIFLGLVFLPFFGVQGAPLGVASLLCGFIGETAVVWWGVRGRRRIRLWRESKMRQKSL